MIFIGHYLDDADEAQRRLDDLLQSPTPEQMLLARRMPRRVELRQGRIQARLQE